MKLNLYTPILSTLLIVAIVSSCSPDKTAQLEELKVKRADIEKNIASLEKELNVTDTTKAVVKSKEVVVIEINPHVFNYFVQTQGLIQAENNILVSAKSMGVLTQVFVREGDAVNKGQILAQIDNSLLLSSIEEVKGSMELANTVYERQKNLWEQKIGTEVQYLQARNNKESLERRLATLQEQIEMTKIKAPITGTIDAVNVKIGENVAPGLPAFRVINTSDLKVALNVSEAYANAINKGNKVTVTITDSGKTFESSISFVGKNIDPLSRSFPVEVKLPSSRELRPNMTAVIRVIFQTYPSALSVPINVVQDINGEKVVYVAESNGTQLVARKRIIKIDGVYGNQAHVLSGLQAGDKIVTVGYQGLNDGQFIKM
jgi:membrane fusion protein (multidrug efflux system)